MQHTNISNVKVAETHMPRRQWTVDPGALVRAFEARHSAPEAGALLSWAVWSVDSLHYLDDIDQAYDASRQVPGGHQPDVVEVSHVRWATGTCITAVDLCAASLGRTFCGYQGPKELDLVNFYGSDPSKKKVATLRTQLPPAALNWVDAVLADTGYQEVKAARNRLTHARLSRHFRLSASGPHRVAVDVGARRLSTRALVELARDTASRHVSGCIAILNQL